jgi:hypothetical protein
MDADIPVPWVRDWLNCWISHRTIRVHLRPSAAKKPLFLITQPQPDRWHRMKTQHQSALRLM